MSTIDKLGNGVGLLYAKNASGIFTISGIDNDPAGVETIKRDALTRAPVGFSVGSTGTVLFVTIAVNDTITGLLVNGVQQINTGAPIAITVGGQTAAATALALAINSFVAASGVDYTATVVGAKVFVHAPVSAGGTVNNSVVQTTFTTGGHTLTETPTAGGQSGGEVISNINNISYFLNATASAVEGNTTGATDISRYVIKRGTEAQMPTLTKTVASSSILDLVRVASFQLLNAGATAATNLDNIAGDFAINDVLIVRNTSSFTVTVRDKTLGSGNIKISPTTFAMANDDATIWLQYIEDSTDGTVWKEIDRSPKTVGANSITSTELALLSVGTPELIALAVTEAKIAALAVTQAKLALLSVGAPQLIALAVTQAKLALLSVGTAQLIASSVDATRLGTNAVITAKILDANVTLEKLEADLHKGFFTFPISWETGELGIIKARIPFSLTVNEVLLSVSKNIAATDTATFIPKNNAGTAMTGGQIDVVAGTALGNDFTRTPTANNTFVAAQVMQFETSKTTPGGKGIVTVSYTRT